MHPHQVEENEMAVSRMFCRNEFQAAAQAYLAECPLRNDQRRIGKALAAGLWPVIMDSPRYCPHTDGFLGSDRELVAIADSQEDAEAAIQAMFPGGVDAMEAAVYWLSPLPPEPLFEAPVSDDDIPF